MSIWDFLFKSGFFSEFMWVFTTNFVGRSGFGIYSLTIGYCTWSLLLQMWEFFVHLFKSHGNQLQ